MMTLPEPYVEQIKTQLREEAEDFLRSYREPRTYGLRINSLKISEPGPATEELKQLFNLTPVPWCSTGYYYEEAARPGKHPYHAAGLYYIQEPSAMSAAELLNPQPGEIVLDLAGAPGGKSTQIAAKLQGRGLLIANEIHPARAKILSENIERIGVRNCVVTSATPDALARKFPQFFDRIMLDAPCSGEGMFRKDPDAVAEWSTSHVTMCAARQSDILNQAALMLKPNGLLAYSTCTFNEEENERTIHAFLEKHPAFALLRMERIWPHRQRGEGHFVAVLRNNAMDAGSALRSKRRAGGDKPKKSTEFALFQAFAEQHLKDFHLLPGEPVLFGEQLYWLPHAEGSSFGAADLDGLRTLRPGLHLAAVKKARIEPAHALALALHKDHALQTVTYAPDSPELQAYMQGETLSCPDSLKGWVVVCAGQFPIGWGKASLGQLKNHYPKGLRSFG